MDIELLDIQEEDLERIRKWRNSPEVARYMYTDEEITSEQQIVWFQKIKNDQTCKHWIVQYNGNKVGVAHLNAISALHNSCYWSFHIGDESHRGSGLGLKVEYHVLNYAFNECKLNKVNCEVFVFNDGVIRMHELFGFRREAYFRQHVKKNGRYEDVVGLALLRSEWKYMEPAMRKFIYRH
jgi:UDP-4-amino-4,6-dideoxy-N-acetyl-beta-L-altrosamine N-acetyltransferase